jgi:hypothetical protein
VRYSEYTYFMFLRGQVVLYGAIFAVEVVGLHDKFDAAFRTVMSIAAASVLFSYVFNTRMPRIPCFRPCSRNFMLAAVRKDSTALQYVSQEIQSDRDVVLAAVMRNGKVLEYASTELQGDLEVVLAAVRQNNSALTYVGPTVFDANVEEYYKLSMFKIPNDVVKIHLLKYLSTKDKCSIAMCIEDIKFDRLASKGSAEKNHESNEVECKSLVCN